MLSNTSNVSSKLCLADFLNAADTMGIERNVVFKLIDNMHNAFPKWKTLIDSSFLSDEMKDAYERLTISRLDRLSV